MSSSPHWPRRRSRVERLRERGDVRRLLRILDRHDWLVDRDGVLHDLEVLRRIEAVSALGTIDTQTAEAGLVKALEDDDPRVRRAAVEALGPRPSVRDAKALARAAAAWRDPGLAEVRQAAVDLLVENADELYAVEFAQTLVDEEGRGSLTRDEATAVRRLFAANSGPVTDTFANELALNLGAGDDDGRRVVHETLVAMGNVAVVPLVSALADPARSQPATVALGAIRDARAVPALVDVLVGGQPAMRAAAARALGEIRDPRALEPLVRASGDMDPAVRDAALDALDRMRTVLAMLGAAALVADDSGRDIPATTDEPNGRTLQPGGRSPDQRTLIQRLLGGDS